MNATLPFSRGQAALWRERWGTPFYVYDEQGITDTVREWQAAFAWNPGFREYFAVKATPTPAILRLLASVGCGFDCASVPELVLAASCGARGSDIMFTSNETQPHEYRAAAELGAIVNLDDLTQVTNLAESSGVPETVCCRYNPGAFHGTNAFMGDLADSKFGMPRDQLFQAFSLLRDLGATRFGVHAMLASCSLDEDYYPALARELFSLANELRRETGVDIAFVDLAGGIGIPYRLEDRPVDFVSVGARVHMAYDELVSPEHPLAIYTELGRAITGPHGYLVASVVGHKHTFREYVGLDASAADLMRPAMYGAHHHISVLGSELDPPDGLFDVVGPLCENNDKFAVQRPLPETEVGDLVAIHSAGAHGRSMGYNYNGRPRCGELLLHPDGSAEQIRRRETIEDLFATLDVDDRFSILGTQAGSDEDAR